MPSFADDEPEREPVDPYADLQPGEFRFFGNYYVYRPRRVERQPDDKRLRPVSLQIRCLLAGLLAELGTRAARDAVEISGDAYLSALRGWAMPATVERLEYWARGRAERLGLRLTPAPKESNPHG